MAVSAMLGVVNVTNDVLQSVRKKSKCWSSDTQENQHTMQTIIIILIRGGFHNIRWYIYYLLLLYVYSPFNLVHGDALYLTESAKGNFECLFSDVRLVPTNMDGAVLQHLNIIYI